MVSYHKQLYKLLLNAVGDTANIYYEQYEEEKMIPCVTYLEVLNNTSTKGDTLSYSSIGFQIKIFAKTISQVIEIANKVDSVLEKEGFTRTSSLEMTDKNIVTKILKYEAIGFERI